MYILVPATVVVPLFVTFHHESPINQLINFISDLEILPFRLDTFGSMIVLFLALIFLCIHAVSIIEFLLMSGMMYMLITKFWLDFIAIKAPRIYLKLKKKESTTESVKKKLMYQKHQKDILDCCRNSFIQLKLFNKEFNCFIQYLAPTAYGIGFVVCVLSLYGILKLYEVVGMPIYLLFPAIIIFIAFFVVNFFILAVDLKVTSEKFIALWLQINNSHMNKFAKSCVPLVLSIGPYFDLERSTTLSFLNLVVDNTVNLVLM